ncbi:hypothetical protein [Oceanicoccus sagamiensis]|uniref:Uncharacterized protein n=1 Tax=Oceanicoccus sagamiensis TaxID=716816 RepID=A0A1X9NCP3_9GAMM|nr:hypothetical protein [Oceanicoccus sagamiensis]ARN74814.1 hypothetical protein BST96_12215 [Oceanicoccus sagamiensis]
MARNIAVKVLIKSKTYFWIGTGALAIWFLALPLIKAVGIDPNGALGKFLLSYSSEILLTGVTSIALSMVIFILNSWAEDFWSDHIQPIFTEYVEAIESSTEEAQQTIVDFQQTLTHEMRENSLDQAIILNNHESIKSRLPVILENVYGTHCTRADGFYNFLEEGVMSFLDPRKPHRSAHFQKINIVKDGDRVKWKERTKFSLHTIALDSQYRSDLSMDPETNYPFEYTTTAKYEDLESLIITISVNGTPICSTEGVFSIVSQDPLVIRSNNDNITATHLGGGDIQIIMKYDIPINRAMTEIITEEESYLDDNDYMFNIKQPTHGATVQVTLPEKWKFEFFHVSNKNNLEPPQADNERTLHKKGWMMPGILMSCRWIATEDTE